ncbi:hypothetical protein ACPWUF_03725 [Bisgaard Taxon 46]
MTKLKRTLKFLALLLVLGLALHFLWLGPRYEINKANLFIKDYNAYRNVPIPTNPSVLDFTLSHVDHMLMKGNGCYHLIGSFESLQAECYQFFNDYSQFLHSLDKDRPLSDAEKEKLNQLLAQEEIFFNHMKQHLMYNK